MLNKHPSVTLKNMEAELDQGYMVKPSGILHWLWEGGGEFKGEGKKMIHVTMGKYSKKIKINH